MRAKLRTRSPAPTARTTPIAICRLTSPDAKRALPPPSGDARPGEGGGGCDARQPPRRADAEDDPRRHRHEKREAQRGGIERDIGKARRAGRKEVDEHSHPNDRQQNADRSPEAGEYEMFDQQLTREAPGSGTERRPDRQLAIARGTADHEQVRHVGAGHEQDETDGAQQDVEQPLALAHQLLLQS